MKYEKTLISVKITTKSGDEITVADTVDNAVGSAVWNAIIHGDRILYTEGDVQHYIAHDCVCSAEATRTTEEVEKPDGDCKPIEVCPEEP